MNGAKGIAGVSLIALVVYLFTTMAATKEVKDERQSALFEVQLIKFDCNRLETRGNMEGYSQCMSRLAEAEAGLTNKSVKAEKRSAESTEKFDAIADAAAKEMNAQSNGELDLEAATAAKLAEIPD